MSTSSTNGGRRIRRPCPSSGAISSADSISLQDPRCLPQRKPRISPESSGLIFAYRNVGHLIADVDPLGDGRLLDPIFDLETHGLSEDHLDRIYDTGHLGGPKRITLRELIRYLSETYCRKIGVEYIHIQDREVRRWLQEEMEPSLNKPEVANEKKRRILSQLMHAEVFESFLNTRYQGQKRFSLEGVEAVIPALHQFMDTAADTGAEEVVMGMAHRGRLNVLANILRQTLFDMIFHEFEDNLKTPTRSSAGTATSSITGATPRTYDTVRRRRPSTSALTANPSHLEAVDPVVEGRTRAKQRRTDDTERPHPRSCPLLIHGDAAFAGQGLVAETFNLSQLKGYRTGGTVHIVVNNQIGFTTTPRARRARHATPPTWQSWWRRRFFHVNGDDPEAVAWMIESRPADTGREVRARRGGGHASATAATATTRATNPPSPSP